MIVRSKRFFILMTILLIGGIFILLAEYFFDIQPNNLIACPEESIPCEDEDLEKPDQVGCTLDAKQCPDGSYVGRVGPDCEFAGCPAADADGSITLGAKICSEASKQVDACIEIYQPVCGLVEVQCITTPCDPVPETFGNSCQACAAGNVISYTEGECAADVSIE